MRVRVPFCAIASVDFFGGDEKANKSEGFWWAHKGSNLGPLPCEGNASDENVLFGVQF
jgi:hypothetical protein